jgi:glycerol-3-phosphate dehydrogenase
VTTSQFDLLVIGGGINGAGIARDAAGRGLKTLLVEQHDLAAHTSSASTKLIHGGLRYLELMHFGLVRKALKERDVLLATAPHLIAPLSFVLPHDGSLRPAWLIRCGLFLYDHLAKRERLPASESIDLRTHEAGGPLRSRARRGFRYWDGWVDDARLVVLNAVAARELGADVRTRTRCAALEPAGGGWRATLHSNHGAQEQVTARAVVNATGPWAASFLESAARVRSPHGLRLVRGSHIVVRKLFDHTHAYVLQGDDRRIVFAIPYEHDFTLIGTTDVDQAAAPEQAQISAAETDYLCALSNRYFERQISPSDVVWSYSGVRPLLADESSDARTTTRDFVLEMQHGPAPLLTAFGGKITTYRVLAEQAVDQLAPLLNCTRGAWTSATALPGGNISSPRLDDFIARLITNYHALPLGLLTRFAHQYGTYTERVLANAQSSASLGRELAPSLFERELEYLRDHEWAQCADDVLWRRTKLGLRTTATERSAVEEWFASSRPAR